MEFIYKQQKVFYERMGRGIPIIFLHGWGSSSIDFWKIANVLKEKYTIYLIDLPGFGKSETLHSSYNLEEYSSFLEAFVSQLNLKNIILVGHSFGGRIAIRYSINHPVQRMILISSAGIKNQSVLIKMKVLSYKLQKWYHTKFNHISQLEKLREKYGSSDYLQANMVMRETLKKIINIDQRKELKIIPCEVLLLWGVNDHTTKKQDGKTMLKLIKRGGIVWFENSTHFLYLEEETKFIKVMKSYLGVN